MSAIPVFADWRPETALAWGLQPQCLRHRWHLDPLFSPAALAELIERYPVADYALVRTSQRGEAERRWHEGDADAPDGWSAIPPHYR